jgi:pyruvate dehydrogenase (quinone)/pyruvate oxidase
VVAFVGDGGLTMLMSELATCVKYGLDIKIVVIKNNSLAHIKWEQMVFLGNPEYGCDLQPIDFAAVARGFGLAASTIDDPARCGETLRQALATRGPVLIECVTDPNEPPIPPKATLRDAAQLAKALIRGSPDGAKIARTVMEHTVREIV